MKLPELEASPDTQDRRSTIFLLITMPVSLTFGFALILSTNTPTVRSIWAIWHSNVASTPLAGVPESVVIAVSALCLSVFAFAAGRTLISVPSEGTIK